MIHRGPRGPSAQRGTLLLTTALLTGCAAGASLDARTVLNHDQCQGLEPGLTRVDFATLAGIRGSRLLGVTTPEAGPEQEAGARDLVLVAISRGTQPTPGYGFSLAGARREYGTAVVDVRWQTPEPGAMLPQVITHPCLVVGLPQDGLTRVTARDQSGKVLGAIDL